MEAILGVRLNLGYKEAIFTPHLVVHPHQRRITHRFLLLFITAQASFAPYMIFVILIALSAH
jgi:hypothetical protein